MFAISNLVTAANHNEFATWMTDLSKRDSARQRFSAQSWTANPVSISDSADV
jgi:hypothetical protein